MRNRAIFLRFEGLTFHRRVRRSDYSLIKDEFCNDHCHIGSHYESPLKGRSYGE